MSRLYLLQLSPGVSGPVRGAQFVGVLVGVLMEDECPQGLQHIAYGAGHKLMLDGKRKSQKRLVAASLLRLVVGYLFLACLFINIAQNSDVIAIFYDVLALEFVENIDDTTFALAKKGFFGQKMLVATIKKHTLEVIGQRESVMGVRELFGGSMTSVTGQRRLSRGSLSAAGLLVSNSRSNNFARFMYFLNGIVLLAGLTYISVKQGHGGYRCKTISVSFNEEVWEGATVMNEDGSIEERLLIYPYFNGVYKEEGRCECIASISTIAISRTPLTHFVARRWASKISRAEQERRLPFPES